MELFKFDIEPVMQVEKYERIRELWEDLDLTQEKIGRAINVPQRSYAYYESRRRAVPPHVLCVLADFYGISVDYILGRTNRKETNR